MVLSNVPLNYPSAREWMWSYCVYLGPFTSSDGKHFDLGIFIDSNHTPSAAIVYGNDPGNYYSGELETFGRDTEFKSQSNEIYDETRKRAFALGLISESLL